MRSTRTRLIAAALGAAIALGVGAGAANAADYYGDQDWNPPGPAGGPGTNWENPPGPIGGPGASPDLPAYGPGVAYGPSVAYGPGVVLILPGARYWKPYGYAPTRWRHRRHHRHHRDQRHHRRWH